MIMEMQDQLRSDVENGIIAGLRLIKTDNEVIKSNRDADIYKVFRPIVASDENCFYVETKTAKGDYLDLEAYYGAFDYYDGDILRAVTQIPSAVYKEDMILTDEWEVIRSY